MNTALKIADDDYLALINEEAQAIRNARPVIPAEYARQLLERFVETLDVREQSRKTYARQLQAFVAWLEDSHLLGSITQLSRNDLLSYKRHLEACSKTPATIGGYITVVRLFYSWLEDETEGKVRNISKNLRVPPKSKNRRDALTSNQVKANLSHLSGRNDAQSLRDFAIFNLAVRAGLRCIELSRATVGNIGQIEHSNEQGGRVVSDVLYVTRKGKSEAEGFVVLTESVLDPIKRYLKSRGNLSVNAPLFCSHSRRNLGEVMSTRSISRVIKNSIEHENSSSVSSPRLTAHSLRKTCAVNLLSNGGTIIQAQDLLGHSDISTTRTYTEGMSRLKAAGERLVDYG